MYCASKAARTTQCTIFCGIAKDKAWELNSEKTAADQLNVTQDNDDALDNGPVPYSRDIFDALCHRYEEPMANNRWDSPLFVVIPDGKLDLESIYAVLYDKKPPPPNLSTQNVCTIALQVGIYAESIWMKFTNENNTFYHLSSVIYFQFFLLLSPFIYIHTSYTFCNLFCRNEFWYHHNNILFHNYHHHSYI